MKPTLLKMIFIAALMLAMLPAVNALESTLTLQGGVSYGISDMDANRTLFGAFGLSYELWLKDYLSVGLNPYITRIQGEDNLNSYKSDIWGADLYLKLRPTKFMALNFPDKAVINRIAPFIAAGVGIAHYDGKGAVDVAGLPVLYTTDGFAATLPFAAAGVSILTKWNVNLDLGIKLDYTTTDEIDNKVLDNLNDGLYTPYIGIGFNFGHKKPVPTPMLLTAGSFTKFNAVEGTPSAAQSYTLSGTDLTGNIDVIAPTGFEVSTNNGTTYGKTANLAPDFAGPVLVRMTGVQSGNYGGSVVHTSAGAVNVNMTITGTVSPFIPAPVILLDGSLAPFTTVKGTPSAAQSYILSGTNITSKVDVSAPNGFEISSNDGKDYDRSTTLSPAINRTIMVRMTGAETGAYSGRIVHTSSGALQVTQPVSGTVTEAVVPEDLFLPVVHFDTNYYVLHDADKILLDALAVGLKKFPNLKLQVRGHTDSTGPDSINDPLGVNRAKVVKDYLVNKGISASRLEVKGFSWSKPVDTNDTVEGRSNNRRTDFLIIK